MTLERRSTSAHQGVRQVGRLVLPRIFHVGFVLSAALSVGLLALFVLSLNASGWNVRSPALTVVLLILLIVDAVGCVGIVVFDYNTLLPQADVIVRATLVSTLLTVVVDTINKGVGITQLVYLFQFGCIIGFELSTEQRALRHEALPAPWEISDDPERRRYIPLNFFNLFWVFVVASVAGLAIETVWHALITGQYENRAGLLWGPFSPIYGFGAVLMTIALNRWWNRSKVVIFVVAGVIGAAFEFAVSWILETSFGIVAWNYAGSFLSVDGRTNFAAACAWGFLGLVWIRLLLPDLLKLVDAVPVRARAALTIAVAMFLLVDVAMTLITTDRWYGRAAGVPASNAVEQYVDAHYGDAEMAAHFPTMNLDPSRAQRTR